MAKYAKWIAGGLGWALGGVIGGILGFAIGSVFDTAERVEYQNIYDSDNPRAHTRGGDFVASILVLAAAVMKADGKVLKAELNYVKQFFVGQFGPERTKEYMLTFRDILEQEIPLKEVCAQIRHFTPPAERLQLIHFLFNIAGSDGHFDEKELEVIHQIAAGMGVSQVDFESIQAMFIKISDADYKILEVESEATDDEVKKAYRKMAAKHHPDKVSHLGEDIQNAAKEKFQKVQEAYENIKKSRGIR